eukprot:GHUV01024508.1.p1 GENE.GHUV01024508.1~~GHUV01024508.1.p1  ORF type:complete len:248 (+),score=67.40 GHUV01024508.1:161-904(+)
MHSALALRSAGRCMLRTSVGGQHARVQRVVVRSGEGVPDLISRDRKQVDITDAFDDTPQAPSSPPATTATTTTADAPSTSSPAAASNSTRSSSSSSRPRQQRGPKTRRQRQADIAQAADAADEASSSGSKGGVSSQARFKKCKDAIDAGLEAFQAKKYVGAIELFNLALELPGNGELVDSLLHIYTSGALDCLPYTFQLCGSLQRVAGTTDVHRGHTIQKPRMQSVYCTAQNSQHRQCSRSRSKDCP